MGSIANRLGRLEGTHAPPCPKCGHDGDPSKLLFEVAWADEEPGEPARCGECGRALEIVVTWADDE